MNKLVFLLAVLIFEVYTLKAPIGRSATSTQTNSTKANLTQTNSTQNYTTMKPSIGLRSAANTTKANSTHTNSTQVKKPMPTKSPYLVNIKFFNKRFCAGSLITMQHILTSHHCMGTKAPGVTSFNLKANVGNTGGKDYEEREVLKVIRNVGFDKKTVANDIAILEVQPAFTKTSQVYPIQVMTFKNISFDSCYMSAWNTQVKKFNTEIKIINRTSCNLTYKGNLPDKTFCSMIIDKAHSKLLSPKAMCEYHYGTPVICDDILTGVMSYYTNCGFPNDPAVFTEVSMFYSWLNNGLPHLGFKQPSAKTSKSKKSKVIGRSKPVSNIAANLHYKLSVTWNVIILAVLHYVAINYRLVERWTT